MPLSNNPRINLYASLEQDSPAHCLSFHPKDYLIAIGMERDGFIIHDLIPLKPVQKIPVAYSVHAIQWSPDGSLLATGSINNDTVLWETGNWKKYVTLPDSDGALNFSWSPDGKFLAIGSWHCQEDSSVEVWSTKDWSKVKTRNDYRSRYVSFSPDGSFLALQYKLTGIEVLSVPTFKRVAFLDFSDSKKYVDIYSPRWSPNGQFLAASCGDGRVRIWRTAVWSVVHTLKLHGYWSEAEYQVAFSPDSRYLISGGFGSAKLLSTANREEIYQNRFSLYK